MKLAKRLKKEKVNVDIINFGEEVSKDGLGGMDLIWLQTEQSFPIAVPAL